MDVQVLCVNHMDDERRDVTWRTFAGTRTIEETDAGARIVRVGRRASIARLDVCPALVREMRKLTPDRFDLLHLHVPNPTMILALAICRPKVPWVVTYHSDVVRQKALLLLQRPFENWVFNRARAILATSPEYAKGSAYLRKYASKTAVVPFGIDLEPYQNPSPAARQAAVELRRGNDPLWLAVGRLVYYKGLDVAIRALAKVPGRLMIVGDGPLKDPLQRLAREAGVSDRIVWRGRLEREELVGAYHAATALWFPSNARSEAFGLVQVEAMASGCPVINCQIEGSGVPWVSRHEESGLTTPINDPDAFAAAANRLLRESGLRSRLSLQSRARAQSQFAAEHMSERTTGVYSHALVGAVERENG